MTPYFLVLIISIVVALVGRKSGNAKIRHISIGLVVLLLTFFAGFRGRAIGTDTGNYVDMLSITASFEDVWRTTEIGFNALMLLCKSISDDYSFFLTVISFIVVSSYVVTIVRTTARYETALFLFIVLGAYTFFFNGARQGIATALCFFALPYLLERRWAPYFILIGIAALFHHTALVAGPLYFLVGTRTGWRQILAVIVGIVLLIVFLAAFVQVASLLLDDKYAVYSEVGEGGGRVVVVFLVAQGLMLFALRRQVRDTNNLYARLLNIYLFGLIPAVAATLSSINPSGLLRITTYFSHVALLLWPMVFLAIRNNLVRGLASLVFLVTSLAFFFLTTSAFGDLVPYEIRPELVWWK